MPIWARIARAGKAWGTTERLLAGAALPPLLIDQGSGDELLADQLIPQELLAACRWRGIEFTSRMQPDYDHSYHFIASFIGEHPAFHARHLKP